MSVHPSLPDTVADPDKEHYALSVVVGWHVPIGGELHHIQFSHDFPTQTFKLKIDDLDKIPYIKPSVGCLDSMFLNDVSFDDYMKNHAMKFTTWVTEIEGKEWRVVLDKEALELWGNGIKVEVIDGNLKETATDFELDGTRCRIGVQGDENTGIIYTLFVNDEMITMFINKEDGIQKCLATYFLLMERKM